MHEPFGAVALPQGVTIGPSVGGISEYRLSNRHKVRLLPGGSQAKITVNITYLVGSRHESCGRTEHSTAAFRKYVDFGKWSVVKVGDKKKAERK